VAAFLAGKIAFTDIPRAISSALDALAGLPSGTRDQLLAADATARSHVQQMLKC
jgi:1-deoxy-D-xylulose 5-phosphate reductoisomerase